MVFIAVSPTGLLTSWSPHSLSRRIDRSPVRPVPQTACHALFHRALDAVCRRRAGPPRRKCYFLFQECIAIAAGSLRPSLSAAKQCHQRPEKSVYGPAPAARLNKCFKLEKRASAGTRRRPRLDRRTARCGTGDGRPTPEPFGPVRHDAGLRKAAAPTSIRLRYPRISTVRTQLIHS